MDRTVIIRRLGWGPARSFLILFGVLAAASAALAARTTWLAVPAAIFFGLAAVIALGTARARTEIGVDGIHNRFLVRTVFIPWSAVRNVVVSGAPPRNVTLVRRGGHTTLLAALRDADTPPDGLTIDDIADLIRERASLPEADTPLGEPRPFSIRPSRLPLIWVLPSAAAAIGASFLLGGAFHLAELLALAGVLLVILAVKLLRGGTDAGRDGLRNRLLIRWTPVPWEEVTGLTVVPTLFGRIVVVGRDRGKRIRLAAPREGLLSRGQRVDEYVETIRALAAEAGHEAPPVDFILVWGARCAYLFLIGAAIVVAVVGRLS